MINSSIWMVKDYPKLTVNKSIIGKKMHLEEKQNGGVFLWKESMLTIRDFTLKCIYMTQ